MHGFQAFLRLTEIKREMESNTVQINNKLIALQIEIL